MAEEQLHPTSAADWRRPREEGYLVTLPSGNVARLRPVALDVLMMSGSIPDILTPLAAKLLWSETELNEVLQDGEKQKTYAELVNRIVPAAMLEPRVVSLDDEEIGQESGGRVLASDEVLLEDIDFNDKLSIFQLAILPAESVRRFCERQAADVEAVSDGEGDQPEAE